MDVKLCIIVLLSATLQVSDCLHYYKTPALDNQFSNFNITASIPSDGINGSESKQEALLFKQYNRRYLTFNFKGKGHAQLQFFFIGIFIYFKVEIGGGTHFNEVSIYAKNNATINSTNLNDITSEREYRSFYVRFKWTNLTNTYRVYVGLGSDPRTNGVLYADLIRAAKRKHIHHILISTASDCLGEWQFATAGQIFGGCGNGTMCSNNSINIECQNDDESGESKETGLIGTCTPELDDISTVTFGNGTLRKATQHSTDSYLHATPMRSGCLVATIDRTLPSLVFGILCGCYSVYGYC